MCLEKDRLKLRLYQEISKEREFSSWLDFWFENISFFV